MVAWRRWFCSTRLHPFLPWAAQALTRDRGLAGSPVRPQCMGKKKTWNSRRSRGQRSKGERRSEKGERRKAERKRVERRKEKRRNEIGRAWGRMRLEQSILISINRCIWIRKRKQSSREWDRGIICSFWRDLWMDPCLICPCNNHRKICKNLIKSY